MGADIYKNLFDHLSGKKSELDLYNEAVDVSSSFRSPNYIKAEKLKKAKDITTHPDILDELADYPDKDVQEAVAMNSTAKLPVLVKLAGYGINVHKNPIFLKLTSLPKDSQNPLFDKDLYSSQDKQTSVHKLNNFLNMVSHPSAGQNFIRTIISHPHPRVVAAAVKHENFPSDLLFKTAFHPSPYVRLTSIQSSKSSPLLFDKMLDGSLVLSTEEKNLLAKSHKINSSALLKLCQDPSPNIRSFCAKNRLAKQEVSDVLINDPDVTVRMALIKNPFVSAVTLGKLANDTDPEVRALVARHRDTPQRILEKLCSDSSTRVRYNVARNNNATATILDRLANDTDERVRNRVKSHINAAEHTINRIKASQHKSKVSFIKPDSFRSIK